MYANYNDATIEDIENVDKQVQECYKSVSDDSHDNINELTNILADAYKKGHNTADAASRILLAGYLIERGVKSIGGYTDDNQ